jgi:hypothetical protein
MTNIDVHTHDMFAGQQQQQVNNNRHHLSGVNSDLSKVGDA